MLALQLHVFAGELREVRGGTVQVIDAMAADGEVHLGIQIDQVEQERKQAVAHLAGGGRSTAHEVVIATPADISSDLWKSPPPPVRDHLAGIRYSRIDYVYLQTSNRVEIAHRGRPRSMEVMPTASRGTSELGGIYQANDWVNEGGLLLVTAARAARAADIPDDELLDRLHADAEALHPELAGDHMAAPWVEGAVRSDQIAAAGLVRG